MDLEAQESITNIDRDFYIENLLPFTNKTREYYKRLTDKELMAEYERLIRLD